MIPRKIRRSNNSCLRGIKRWRRWGSNPRPLDPQVRNGCLTGLIAIKNYIVELEIKKSLMRVQHSRLTKVKTELKTEIVRATNSQEVVCGELILIARGRLSLWKNPLFAYAGLEMGFLEFGLLARPLPGASRHRFVLNKPLIDFATSCKSAYEVYGPSWSEAQ